MKDYTVHYILLHFYLKYDILCVTPQTVGAIDSKF